MHPEHRSAAERYLNRVPIREQYWDRLYELAQAERQEMRDWAGVQLERLIARKSRTRQARVSAA